MKKINWKEVAILSILVLVFIFVRSVYFSDHLNFTSDQGEQSTQVLELFRQHKVPLIGNPITSVQYQGRLMFQGPAYYYMLFVFLFLTHWDPIASSYLFMLFCSLMIFPLFYGVSLLINKKSALVACIVYTLLPYYVNYTRFHWNPTYQLSLIPILFLLMGLYQKYKTKLLFLAVSIFLGILLHFHYQFIFAVIGIFLYYFVIRREQLYKIFIFILGLIIGLSPLLLFEVKNHFYNLNTLLLYYNHRSEVSTAGTITTPHYYLSFSFIALIGLLGLINWVINFLKKKKNSTGKFIQKTTANQSYFYIFIGVLAIILFTRTALLNFTKPTQSFWSLATYWNYPDEHRVYEIIKQTGLMDYNVANLTYYDTRSAVIKYLLKRDNVQLNYDDYYHNKYLFVISRDKDLDHNMPYEVDFFKPKKLLKTWVINKEYSLYLLERLPKE